VTDGVPDTRIWELLPLEAKASWARLTEASRRQQAHYDAMELGELQETATASLRTAAKVLSGAKLTAQQREDGWTPVEVEQLATYFLQLAENAEQAGPCATINLVMWFDFARIESRQSDQLADSARNAVDVYNAYVSRKWRD
jgi:hypothetical protein